MAGIAGAMKGIKGGPFKAKKAGKSVSGASGKLKGGPLKKKKKSSVKNRGLLGKPS
jgi:hypothetical protein